MKQDDIKEIIGNNIRKEREAKGWSQSHLAKACGWLTPTGKGSASRISNYEKGVREPKHADLVRIANALKISKNNLLHSISDQYQTTNGIYDLSGLEFIPIREVTYPLLKINNILEWIGNPDKSKYSRIKLAEMIIANDGDVFVLDLTDEARKSEREIGLFPTKRVYGIFKLGSMPRDDSIVVVKINDKLVVRKYMEDGMFRKLKPYDPIYPIIDLDDPNIEIEIIAVCSGNYNGDVEIIPPKE